MNVDQCKHTTPSYLRKWMLILSMLCALLHMSGTGFAQQKTESLGSSREAYRLQAGDTISVFYRLTPEYNQSLAILPDGYVDLRLIGRVHVGGLSVEEARQLITKRAYERLRDPEVSVSVTEFVRDQFTVMGEVGKPGRYELHGATNIVDALALANGFTQLSAQKRVVLVRPLSSTSEYGNASIFDFKHLLRLSTSTALPAIQNGDIIIVTTSKFAKLTGIVRLLNVGIYYNPIPAL